MYNEGARAIYIKSLLDAIHFGVKPEDDSKYEFGHIDGNNTNSDLTSSRHATFTKSAEDRTTFKFTTTTTLSWGRQREPREGAC
jgi:hypothetical protein